MRKIIYLSIIITLPLLSGCGFTAKEIGRISIDDLSTKENIQPKSIELNLNDGDNLSYWTEMNIEFEGELALEFQVQLSLDGKTLGIKSFDPFDRDITMGEFKSTVLNKTKWKFSGRMKEFNISQNGNYKFEVILISNGNESLKLNKAEFVFKK